jgi:hypothetical protein
MSVRGLRPFLLSAGMLLAVCADAQVKTRPCELPQVQRKIPVLVLDQKAKTPERAAEHWRRALRHKDRYFPFEIAAYTSAEDLRATGAGSLPELGIRSGSALVLARDDREQWLAVIEPRANDSLDFPVPTATRVREKEVKQVVRSFAQYYSGDYVCALEGFTSLESKRHGSVGGGELELWIGSMLARLGRDEEEARRLRQAAVSNAAGGEKMKSAAGLGLAQLLLPRAPYDPGVAKETRALLEDAARGLRETDGRYWVASQAALGRYWLLLSGARSAEGLRRAQAYFEQAEFSLVLPRDELATASLHAMMAMTELQLEQSGGAQEEHLQKALDHFTVVRAIWSRHGAEAEAASQQIRSIQARAHR